MGKNIKLFFNIIFSIILFSLLFSPANVKGATEAGIDIKVTGGYDNTGIMGCYNTFKIHIKNSDDSFSGELQIVAKISPKGKYTYACPVNLVKNSEKIITLSSPVLTLNDKVHFQLISDKKTIKTQDYEFKRLLPMDNNLFGIMCDDSSLNSLRDLLLVSNPEFKLTKGFSTRNNISVLNNSTANDSLNQSTPIKPSRLIKLTGDNFPDDIMALRAFGYIMISNFDTSSLSDKQRATLSNWVDEGGVLILGTGPNWKKVYSSLPDKLKPFSVTSSKTISDINELSLYAGFSNTLPQLSIISGNTGSGKTLIEKKGDPLVINYTNGKGSIMLFTFDPSINPVSSWKDSGKLFEALINAALNNKIKNNRVSTIQNGNYRRLIQDVPQARTPPIQSIMLIIAVYILVISPCTFLFLKWSKKSNLNWFMIPLTAIVFMSVIYMAGFKTRFHSVVTNTLSFINVDNDTNIAHVNTYLAAFNSNPGNMKISYSDNIEINPDNEYYIFNDKVRQQTLCKFSKMPKTLELYGTRIWEEKYMTLSMNKELKSKIFSSVKLENGRITANIKNPTENNFDESFITLGNRFAYLGRINKGEEVRIDIDTKNSSIMKDYNNLFNMEYQDIFQNTKVQKEKERLTETLNFFYQNYLENQLNSITFYTINNADAGYNLLINNKYPEQFNTNIFYTSINIPNNT